MKPKTAIVLGVLLAVCIVLALCTGDLFRSSKPDEDQAKKQNLFDPPPGKPVELTIEGKGGKTAFRKTSGAWRIVEPIQARAEDWRVNEVADAIKDLKGQPAKDVDDEMAGLDKPVWTVTLVDEKKATHRLLVGRGRPMKSDQTYVRPAGSSETFIADADLAGKLDKPLSDFRDETVLDVKSDQIARVRVTGRQSYELVKTEGTWGLVEPVSAAADKDEVQKLLDKVARLTASEFVSDAPKDLAVYGLTQPQLRVQVEMQPDKPPATKPASTKPAAKPKPGKKHGFLLGKAIGDKLYAKLDDAPAVFKVDESLLKDLQPKLVTLRVKKVLTLAADVVTGVEIEVPAGKASLAKTDGAWKMTAPLKGPADDQAVKKLLDAAAGLQADSFKDSVAVLKTYGLDTPAAKLTFRLAGKGETTTVLVGAKTPSGEMTFVKTASALAVAVVKTSDLKSLLAEPATYWDRALMKLADGEKIARLQLRRVDETFTLAPDANSDWTLSTPLTTPADKDQVNKVVDCLEDLSADKVVFLGTQVPDSYAKTKDIMQVVVTTERTPPATQPASHPASAPATKPTTAPATQPASRPATKPVAKTYTVTVAKTGLHAYAWVAGGKIVSIGEFAPSLYDDLAGELRQRRLWQIDPEKVREIKLSAGADSLHLKKQDKTWTYTADTYVKIDTEKVETFLKDVKEPKALKFVTHKPPAKPAEYGLDKLWLILEVTDEAGVKSVLSLSHKGASKAADRYGLASTVPGVFEVEASIIEKLTKKLQDFKK